MSSGKSSWKPILLGLLKYGVSAAILAYLFYQASQPDPETGKNTFEELWEQPKHWGFLLLGAIAGLAAVINTFLRWYVLVRALGLQFHVRDAIRLGFLGYMFNFATVGVVGGDVIKSIFVARHLHKSKTHAVASVFIDRIIGLHGLFVLTFLAMLLFPVDLTEISEPEKLLAIQTLYHFSWVVSLGGFIAFGIMLLPGFATWSFWDRAVHVPIAGPVLERLVDAMRIYRRRAWLMIVAGVMSLGTHFLYSVGIFGIAHGLYQGAPSLGPHVAIVPTAMLANAVPLPGGLGAFEAMLNFLYPLIAADGFPEGAGLVIALAFRFIMLMIASVGLFYWLTARREISVLMEEAKEEA